MPDHDHWTYQPWDEGEALWQGDILKLTPKLKELLSATHAQYCDDKNRFFIVVTQTCDLVLHRNGCKADFISLAIVRELDSILSQLVATVAGTSVPGIWDATQRTEAERLIQRVVNQNEQALGLFYLHKDAKIGIGTHSVALLRVTISVSRDDYEVLRSSRCGRLHTEFQSKLGWLCGNLYSRVATRDWSEKGEKVQADLVKSILQSIDGEDQCYWVHPRLIRAAKRRKAPLKPDMTPDESLALLAKDAPNEPCAEAISQALKITQKLLTDEAVTRICTSFANNTAFIHSFCNIAALRIQQVVGFSSVDAIANALSNSGVLAKQFSDRKPLWIATKDALTKHHDNQLAGITASFRKVNFAAIITDVRAAMQSELGNAWTLDVDGRLDSLRNETVLSGIPLTDLVQEAIDQQVRVKDAVDRFEYQFKNSTDFRRTFSPDY